MNKTSLIILIALMMSYIINAQDTKEQVPLVKLDVLINGEKYQINDGDSLIVNGDTIRIKTSDLMTFDFGALIFDYPKHFSFEYEQDFGYKNWSLDGNDFVIMYFEFEAEVELDVFIAEMVKQFGKKNCKISDNDTQLGKLSLSGKRINVDIIGAKLTYDMYRLTTNDFKTHFIAFQDSKNDDGSDSQEGTKTIEIINKTIQMK